MNKDLDYHVIPFSSTECACTPTATLPTIPIAYTANSNPRTLPLVGHDINGLSNPPMPISEEALPKQAKQSKKK